MRALVARIQESYRNAIAQQRPWSELTDRSLFARPDNLNDALGRIRKNTSYFQANYLSILIVVVILCMLWNPTAILWLALLAAAWVYIFMVRTDALIIAGRTLNEREKFLAMAVISIVIVFGLTSVGSILMSGLVMGAAAIALHAAFRYCSHSDGHLRGIHLSDAACSRCCSVKLLVGFPVKVST
ncbi:unnamed protein product [Closterium sp. Yama58-4]|nr:unnamed protein product [Closterium sp. Yama58-4]